MVTILETRPAVQAQQKICDAQRLLQGHHGLYSELLKDYGFQPPKKGGRKGKDATAAGK